MTGSAESIKRDEAVIAQHLEAELRSIWNDRALFVAEIAPFGDGHSGFTFLAHIAGGDHPGRYVLRLSPPNARIAGPADLGRQGRIMSAVREAGIPAPHVFAMDSGPAIDGRSYVLMELVNGEPFVDAAQREPAIRLMASAMDVLHRIRSIPVHATGIASERVASPHDEIARWSALLDRAPEDLLASSRVLRDALTATCPVVGDVALVHGDYHLGNMLFSNTRVAAVLDWEIAELGDPLIDLGSLALTALRRRYGPEPNSFGDVPMTVHDVVSAYGASQDRARWFVALCCYKYAAILGYNLMLHRAGRRVDPVYEDLIGTMHGLVRDGSQILRNGTAGW